MNIIEAIAAALPELVNEKGDLTTNKIILQNDLDDFGDYIARWDYETPMPKSLAKYVRA